MNDELILIFQMGKVASMTVERTLRNRFPHREVVRTHRLSELGLRSLQTRLNDKTLPLEHRMSVRNLISEAIAIRRMLSDKRAQNKRIRLITLTREPISYFVSCYFQVLPIFLPHLIKGNPIDPACVPEVLNHFQNYLDKNEEELRLSSDIRDRIMYRQMTNPRTWFDLELKTVLGIDIYAQQFDQTRGYEIRSYEFVDMLVVRFEDIQRCLIQALEEFLRTERLTVINENMAKDKPYRLVYEEFLKQVRIPDSFLDRHYESKYAHFFYSREEITQFRTRWRSTEN